MPVVPLPMIFDRVDPVPTEQTMALIPGLVNLQQLGRLVMLPKPYGPRMRPALPSICSRPSFPTWTARHRRRAARCGAQEPHGRRAASTRSRRHHALDPARCFDRVRSDGPEQVRLEQCAGDADDDRRPVPRWLRRIQEPCPRLRRKRRAPQRAGRQAVPDRHPEGGVLVSQMRIRSSIAVNDPASDKWIKIRIPENTVDIFEAQTQPYSRVWASP